MRVLRDELPKSYRLTLAALILLAIGLMAINCASPKAAAAYDRGQGCYNAGDYQCAVREYGAAVRDEPRNSGYRYRLAQALLRVKMPSQAVAELREAIRLDPSNTDARRHLERLTR